MDIGNDSEFLKGVSLQTLLLAAVMSAIVGGIVGWVMGMSKKLLLLPDL